MGKGSLFCPGDFCAQPQLRWVWLEPGKGGLLVLNDPSAEDASVQHQEGLISVHGLSPTYLAHCRYLGGSTWLAHLSQPHQLPFSLCPRPPCHVMPAWMA